MFQVALAAFNGPLDLLLNLVLKHEVDILEVPISKIVEQYLDCACALEALDVSGAGEFIVMAGTLLEIKSFHLLPTEEEVEEELEDPRQELVRQLLSYKKFCEQAGFLEERSRLWQRRYPRLSNDLIPKSRNPAEEPIYEIELWDLVSAFGRIIREKAPLIRHTVVQDEIPVTVFMQRVYNRLKREQKVEFSSLFQQTMVKSNMVGIFLAVLELVRHEYARILQTELFGEIEIQYRESSKPLDFANMEYRDVPGLEQAG